jgi:hypothetical protein
VNVNDAWQQEALCAKIDASDVLFSNNPFDIAAAKTMCGHCPVARQCLDLAMRTETAADATHGIYGGLTPAERLELRRQQVTCQRCGTRFQKRKNQRYCSPECAGAVRREQQSSWQKRHPETQRKHYYHPCADCGQPATRDAIRCDPCNRVLRAKAVRGQTLREAS